MIRPVAGFLVAALALISSPHSVRTASAEKQFSHGWGSREAQTRAHELFKLWIKNPGPETISLYEKEYRNALQVGRPRSIWWYLNALGGAYYHTQEYRQALDRYVRAREVALRAGLVTEAAETLSNLSSLYLHVNDNSAALAAAREAYRILPKVKQSPERIKLLVAIARVFLTCGEGPRATAIFEQVIQDASAVRDAQSESLALDQMGWELLRAGELAHAEEALNTAYQLRVRTADPNLFATEHHLALLYVKKGNLDLASRFIDASFAHRGKDRLQIPAHLMFLTRGRIRASRGNLKNALEDYLQATEAVDNWRGQGLLADSFRISTDALMDEVYAGAIDTAVKLYNQTGNEHFAVLSWELSERIRAASLRELIRNGRRWTQHVPPEYWQLLERFRALESEQFGAIDPPLKASSEQATQIRMRLAEMEARAQAQESAGPIPANEGTDPPLSKPQLPRKINENSAHRISLNFIRQVLGDSRTLISFYLGEDVSYRWVVSGTRFGLSVLPGKREIGENVTRLRAAVLSDSPEAAVYGERVFAELFAGVEKDAPGSHWFITLDDALFKLPIPALVCARAQGRPVYLIERKTLELVAGAWAIGRGPAESREGGFLGLGDGIYNTADSRYTSNAPTQSFFGTMTPALFTTNPPFLQLPRLIGSGREVEQCARESGRASTILTGTSMNRREFFQGLAERPGIIHLAAHFLTEPSGERTAIALGLKHSRTGSPHLEILTAEDIANLQVPGSLVVMSGCSSVGGQIIPAAGLIGLARAWLAAGAHAVIATQWPTPDDTGDIFARFYEHLRATTRGDTLAPAEALRRAQMDMLRSSTWRSKPRYWATYQIFGRSN